MICKTLYKINSNEKSRHTAFTFPQLQIKVRNETMNSPPAYLGGAIMHAPTPITMSDEDADELRSKARSSVGEWVADDAPLFPCVSLTNNAYTLTYGPGRVLEIDLSFTVKCCCCTIQHVTSKGTFDEDGFGGRMEDDQGLKTTYTLVSLDKDHNGLLRSVTYAISGHDKKGLPVTGSAVQSANKRVMTLNIPGAPPLKMTYHK